MTIELRGGKPQWRGNTKVCTSGSSDLEPVPVLKDLVGPSPWTVFEPLGMCWNHTAWLQETAEMLPRRSVHNNLKSFFADGQRDINDVIEGPIKHVGTSAKQHRTQKNI